MQRAEQGRRLLPTGQVKSISPFESAYYCLYSFIQISCAMKFENEFSVRLQSSIFRSPVSEKCVSKILKLICWHPPSIVIMVKNETGRVIFGAVWATQM